MKVPGSLYRTKTKHGGDAIVLGRSSRNGELLSTLGETPWSKRERNVIFSRMMMMMMMMIMMMRKPSYPHPSAHRLSMSAGFVLQSDLYVPVIVISFCNITE